MSQILDVLMYILGGSFSIWDSHFKSAGYGLSNHHDIAHGIQRQRHPDMVKFMMEVPQTPD